MRQTDARMRAPVRYSRCKRPIRQDQLQAPGRQTLAAQKLWQQRNAQPRRASAVEHRRIIDRELRRDPHLGALRTAREFQTIFG
jgi:hypothetical protein